MEEILANLYRIEIPLPNNPLKTLNSYVIKSPERNLIIDTGMNREECLSAMVSGLREIAVDLEKTDFFITHLHADHLGLVSRLSTNTSTIYFNQPDADFLKSADRWVEMGNFALENGFPESELQDALEKHPGFRYSASGKPHFTILRENDVVKIGNYWFECVETPGHTRGHMCLYEPNKKFLISGDHLLGDITPNISLWSAKENPLKIYLVNLKKISKFTVELVLPGHRKIFRNCRERIQQLLHHHQVRTQEILSILKKEDWLNSYQVASQMTWEITYPFWNHFPAVQKWFATGEAIAHLKYLEEKGMVQTKRKERQIVFSLK